MFSQLPAETGAVWRLQGTPADLLRALQAGAVPLNALVVPEAAWWGIVPDTAYVECPTALLSDRAQFVALLAYLVGRGLEFRLFVRAGSGEADGLLLAYPRLAPGVLAELSCFDQLSARQIEALCTRLERFLAGLD